MEPAATEELRKREIWALSELGFMGWNRFPGTHPSNPAHPSSDNAAALRAAPAAVGSGDGRVNVTRGTTDKYPLDLRSGRE